MSQEKLLQKIALSLNCVQINIHNGNLISLLLESKWWNYKVRSFRDLPRPNISNLRASKSVDRRLWTAQISLIDGHFEALKLGNVWPGNVQFGADGIRARLLRHRLQLLLPSPIRKILQDRSTWMHAINELGIFKFVLSSTYMNLYLGICRKAVAAFL